MLDPGRCGGAERHVRVEFPDDAAGLQVRNGVAVPTDGADADVVLTIGRRVWGDVLNGKRTIDDVFDADEATATDEAGVNELLSWFELAPSR